MILNRRTALLSGIATVFAGPVLAGTPPVFSTNGIAIQGYDTVAYFEDNGPVEGSKTHAVSWQGATWIFASAANKETFSANPELYAPQYGGYCAYAVSKGATASTDPNAWTLYKGKLYLNYSFGVRIIWRLDKPGNIKRADGNWPGVLN